MSAPTRSKARTTAARSSAAPNPASDRVEVSFAGLNAHTRLQLVNTWGQIVAVGRPGLRNLTLDGVASGTYALLCVGVDGAVLASARLVIP